VGKSELSFMKFVFWFSPVIFVERNGNVIPGLKASADILKKGKSLAIFPEGTRSSTGELGRFKTGAAYLSKNLGKKIVPVAITGSGEAFPKSRWFPRFFSGAKGRVIAGDPVSPADFSTAEELNAELRRRIDMLMKMR
jgi:1-acyl-sn-glycerol-3-phosphate acyltransferase